MNIAMIGTGYVGLVSGACFADSGNTVTCVDIDKDKIALLNNGGVPIYEPGLEDLIKRNAEEGRLTFTTDIANAVANAAVVFIAVGTPMSDTGEADLSYVMAAAESIGKAITGYTVVVDKSTVPVGTAGKVRATIAQFARHEFDMISNPEFLKEGDAINDFMKPDRVVIGGESERALGIMRELYEPFLRTFHPLIVMDIESAEMTKYASNCFLATKISFINEIANLSEKVGADISLVREGIGADRRIGYEFLFPGVGYGGSCFPKDVHALIHTGANAGYEMTLLNAVNAVNEKQKRSLLQKALDHFQKENAPGAFKGYTFAVWGLSFKPRTDDVREAPALALIEAFLRLGARVKAFDPEAAHEAKKILGEKIEYCATMYDAAEGADALFLVTEWNEFRKPSWTRIKKAMKTPVLFDGRNIYDPKRSREEGFVYYGIGRTS